MTEVVKEFSGEVAGMVQDALIVVAGFTWAEAFKSLFADGGTFEKARQYGPFLVAVLATILAVIGTRVLKKNKSKE